MKIHFLKIHFFGGEKKIANNSDFVMRSDKNFLRNFKKNCVSQSKHLIIKYLRLKFKNKISELKISVF